MRVLHVIHDFLPRHRAGSELYAYRLCRALQAEGVEVEVLCAEYDPGRPHASCTSRQYEGVPITELVNNWRFRSFAETYRSPELNVALDRVLERTRPDVLHVHNLLNLSFDLPGLARARGIPSVATLHDYTLVCPSGGQRLHRAENHVCATIDPDRCSRCFVQSPFAAQMGLGRVPAPAPLMGPVTALGRAVRAWSPRAGAVLEGLLARAGDRSLGRADLEARLSHLSRVFDDITRFVAPSRALGEDFVALGLPRDKLEVSDYGFLPWPEVEPRRPEQVLTIGYVGTLAWHKGVHVLLEACRQLGGERFRVLLFGRVETFPDYVQQLRQLGEGLPVELRGGFAEDEAPSIYSQLDVLVVPSIWPENSPLVIHEAQQAGVPVIGARSGGIPELVRDGVDGLVYEATSPHALAQALRRVLRDRGLLETFRAALPRVKPIRVDAQEWKGRYEASLSIKAPGAHSKPALEEVRA